jgi:hypothetical protein
MAIDRTTPQFIPPALQPRAPGGAVRFQLIPAQGAPDATPPSVSGFAPASGSTIFAATTVEFDVTDNIGENLAQVVTAIHSDGTAEIVWDGAFRGRFASGSVRTAIANGFHFAIQRTGGWPAAGLTIRVYAVDLDANTVTVTATYTVSNPSNATDTTPPSVSDWNPAPGAELELDTPVSFTVTDASGAFAATFISVGFPTNDVETAFQGATFRGRYAAGSSRVSVSGGWRYTLVRQGGWPAKPTFLVDVVDAKGNVV